MSFVPPFLFSVVLCCCFLVVVIVFPFSLNFCCHYPWRYLSEFFTVLVKQLLLHLTTTPLVNIYLTCIYIYIYIYIYYIHIYIYIGLASFRNCSKSYIMLGQIYNTLTTSQSVTSDTQIRFHILKIHIIDKCYKWAWNASNKKHLIKEKKLKWAEN